MLTNCSPQSRESRSPSASSEPIELRAVGFEFPGTQVLRDVTLRVEAGEFVSVMGLSGIGKTTLLKIVAGLLAPASGEVSVPSHRTGRLEMLFQRPLLRSRQTVRQNVELPCRIRGQSCDSSRLLQLVGLSGLDTKFPSQLSGGQQRRVAVARALSGEPRVLLMDEPFSGVDELTREQLFLGLAPLFRTRNQTIVMVTHSFNEAVFLSDRVVILGGQPATLRHEHRVPRPPDDSWSLTSARFHEQVSALRSEFRIHAGEPS